MVHTSGKWCALTLLAKIYVILNLFQLFPCKSCRLFFALGILMLVPPLLQLCLGPDKPAGLSPGPGAPCDMPSVQFLWVTWCGAYRPSSTIFTSNQLTSHYCVMLLWTGPGNSGSVCFPHLGPDHFLHQYRVFQSDSLMTLISGDSSPPRPGCFLRHMSGMSGPWSEWAGRAGAHTGPAQELQIPPPLLHSASFPKNLPREHFSCVPDSCQA